LFLMASSGQGLLRIWKTADWSLTHELQAHRSAIYDMAIAPDGRYVVTCSVDETVRVWAVASGQQVGCFRAEGGVNACAAGVDGRTFIAGDRSGGVHFLRIEP
jgi:WD40 repeat protein